MKRPATLTGVGILAIAAFNTIIALSGDKSNIESGMVLAFWAVAAAVAVKFMGSNHFGGKQIRRYSEAFSPKGNDDNSTEKDVLWAKRLILISSLVTGVGFIVWVFRSGVVPW